MASSSGPDVLVEAHVIRDERHQASTQQQLADDNEATATVLAPAIITRPARSMTTRGRGRPSCEALPLPRPRGRGRGRASQLIAGRALLAEQLHVEGPAPLPRPRSSAPPPRPIQAVGGHMHGRRRQTCFDSLTF
eukprot:scaffold647938_cov45-Prasinocladus_malaysianus.AAC.2